jgi:hypothetical protein
LDIATATPQPGNTTFTVFNVADAFGAFNGNPCAPIAVSATTFIAVATHEIQDACIDQWFRCLTKMGHIGPCTKIIEALRAQKNGCLCDPVRFVAEFLLQRFLRIHAARHRHVGHALVQKKAAVGINEPSMSGKIGRVKKSGRF